MPQYELRGIPVEFPHEAYECQLEYMSRVIQALQESKNALLESPTGTGKTLCLLCAALAWTKSLDTKSSEAPQEEAAQATTHGEVVVHERVHKSWAESLKEAAASKLRGGLPTIIYSSRTHSQLAQVMGELRNTGYRPRTAILGSRQQLCLNPSVSKLPSAAANQACRAAVTSRSCSWYNKVEPFIQKNPDTNQEPLEIEQLVKLGHVRGPCPFYTAREMARTAELVFMPYNYLLDSKVRAGLNMLSLENAVLIFDEAHNVESVCSDSSSFDLPALFLGGCIEEANEAYTVAVKRQESCAHGEPQASEEPNYFETAIEIKIVREMLRAFEGAIAAVYCSGQNGFTRPGMYMYELLTKMKVSSQDDLRRLIAKLDLAAELIAADAAEAGRRSGSGGQKLAVLADHFRLLANSLDPINPHEPPPAAFYRVHVHMEKAGKSGVLSPTLSYWCFMPGLAMQILSRRHVRSFLLTSGTLSPLASFAAELQLPFPITLENPHVIDSSQVWIGVVGVGPQGAVLSSSYANRDNKAYKDDLGFALANFARSVPDGLLVFFPSYVVLQSCIDSWKSTLPGSTGAGGTTWERICRHKQPVIEPREGALFGQATEDFNRKLRDPATTGAIFFAVCRGKVSEGLDFSDKAGRAVVITGIPYANSKDAKVRLKQEVLNEVARKNRCSKRPRSGAASNCLTGDQWYTQQAIRAVNQGMGRVIRHRHDYGAIILCDDRFQAPHLQNQLSAWLRPLVQIHPNFGSATASLTRFFKERAAASAAAPPPPKKAHSPPRRLAFTDAAVRTGAGRGLDRMLSLQVPCAMDTSGLASMVVSTTGLSGPKIPEGESGLMGALLGDARSAAQGKPAATASVLQRGGERGGERGSIADGLLAALSRGESAPRPVQLRQSAQSSKPAMARPRPERQPPSARVSEQPLTSMPIAGGVSAAHMRLVTSSQQQRRGEGAVEHSGLAVEQAQRACWGSSAGGRPAEQDGVDDMTRESRHGSGKSGAQQPLAEAQPAAIGGMCRPGSGAALGTEQTGRLPDKKRDPKDFMARLKQELPATAFQQVQEGLKAYKDKRINSRKLLDMVLEVLSLPGRRHLLNGFTPFVAKADRTWFCKCISVLLSTDAKATPGSQDCLPSVQRHPSKAAGPGQKPIVLSTPSQSSSRQ